MVFLLWWPGDQAVQFAFDVVQLLVDRLEPRQRSRAFLLERVESRVGLASQRVYRFTASLLCHASPASIDRTSDTGAEHEQADNPADAHPVASLAFLILEHDRSGAVPALGRHLGHGWLLTVRISYD